MKLKDTSDELLRWLRVKRQCALTDAHVQMARELGMNPKRLLASETPTPGPNQTPPSQRIESLYLRRFKKPLPDSVVPLRQLRHEAHVRERAEARDRRRRKRQAELDHAEAARISLLTLRRLLPGGPVFDNDIVPTEPPTQSE